MVTEYDKTEIFNKEIKPLLKKMKAICELHKIPMFTTFAVKNNSGETLYKTDGICTGSHEIELKDDQIERHLCVRNGFKIVPGVNVVHDFDEDDYSYIDDVIDL